MKQETIEVCPQATVTADNQIQKKRYEHYIILLLITYFTL